MQELSKAIGIRQLRIYLVTRRVSEGSTGPSLTRRATSCLPSAIVLLLAVVTAGQANAIEAKNYKFYKEMEVTGKNLLLPVAFVKHGTPKEEQEQRYPRVQLLVFAGDGKTLLHRQFFHFPRDMKDLTYWGYLDVSEYVGQKVILAANEEVQENLSQRATFSDEQGKTLEPLYSEKLRPPVHMPEPYQRTARTLPCADWATVQ